jgi:hypothetical protein
MKATRVPEATDGVTNPPPPGKWNRRERPAGDLIDDSRMVIVDFWKASATDGTSPSAFENQHSSLINHHFFLCSSNATKIHARSAKKAEAIRRIAGHCGIALAPLPADMTFRFAVH